MFSRGIDPSTVQFLSSDREFMSAFDFPAAEQR